MAVLSLGVQLCFWGQRGGGHEDYTEETQGAKKNGIYGSKHLLGMKTQDT